MGWFKFRDKGTESSANGDEETGTKIESGRGRRDKNAGGGVETLDEGTKRGAVKASRPSRRKKGTIKELEAAERARKRRNRHAQEARKKKEEEENG